MQKKSRFFSFLKKICFKLYYLGNKSLTTSVQSSFFQNPERVAWTWRRRRKRMDENSYVYYEIYIYIFFIPPAVLIAGVGLAGSVQSVLMDWWREGCSGGSNPEDPSLHQRGHTAHNDTQPKQDNLDVWRRLQRKEFVRIANLEGVALLVTL